jgi:peptide-methionine (S)-S-oxide reductase
MLLNAFVLVFTVGLALAARPLSAETARATFAGGCYWCMEEPFESVPGVLSVTAGWAGGEKTNPKYEEISSGKSGYAEAVEIEYDPSRVTYAKLLDTYWHNIDPLTAGGQFCDRGRQYRSAIFFHDAEQRRLAEDSKARVEQTLHAAVATEISPATVFAKAPDSQQDFYKKSPGRYREYVSGCGRQARLRQIWGDAAGRRPENP